jgi:hypothetical protein
MKLYLLTILGVLTSTPAIAQSGGPWSIASFTIDGGGTASTGGVWKVTGTIGQPDATAAVSIGGSWNGAGGFWPGISTIPVGPALMLTLIGSNQIRVGWTAASVGYKVQYSEDLVSWTDYPTVITGASYLNWSLGNGQRYYFRLKRL